MSVLVLALLCGAVIGLALGALGGGGGVLAVPAQVYLLGVAPADAGTTSLIIVVVTSATALARHAGAGSVRWRTGVLFAMVGAPPAIGASLFAHHMPQTVLTAAFAAVAALAAVAMLHGTRTAHPLPQVATSERATAPMGTAAAAVPPSGLSGKAGMIAGAPPRQAVMGPPNAGDGAGGPASGASDEGAAGAHVASCGRGGRLRTAAAGTGLGTVTGLLGVGGGFLAVPALVSVLRLPMRTAVGTGLVVVLINSLASLTARATAQSTSLDPAVLGPLVGAAVLGAWDGKRLQSKLSGISLQRTFAALLLAVAALMLIDACI
ncbi:sulfite exporter TauE/SafE family protein [Streptomyces microflavus]|uniref:sulfite exporter TauE/SafE family protein n=1 Tax=Streptomyces microflavus TaxID=1919 RepID=UPI0033D65A34